ncbi:MAG: hypothetical protein EBU93_02280 [Chlamydiae bacterium]|nr:hypothetical protein [Chlamydiota bacterium]
MRLTQILLDMTILLVVLFLLALSIGFFLETVFLGQFFSRLNALLFFSLGIGALFLSLLLSFLFVSTHKKNVLIVQFHPKKVEIEKPILQEYIKLKLVELGFDIKNLHIEVDRSQKLHLHIQTDQLPNIENLQQIERELGSLLLNKFSYFKEFQVYFAHAF